MTMLAEHKLLRLNAQKVFFFFLLLLLVGVFYYMNAFEPLRCDDLVYQFYWLGERTSDLHEPIDLNNRIENFNEAFMSQVNHYYVMNGRFSVHFIVSCFCGFIGRSLFSIVNALVYVLFLIGCVRLLEFNYEMNSTATIALLWLGLPIQYIFWYSISFAVNYLWTSTALLYYLIYFKSQISTNHCYSKPQWIALFFASFIVGTLHEGFSLPLSGSVFLYLLFHKQSLKVGALCMALGLWLGTAFVVFAPGTIGRASGSLHGMGIGDFLLMKLDVFRYSKRLYLFLVFLIMGIVINKRNILSFLKRYQIEISFIVFDFIMVLAVPHYSQRIEFPLEMLSLLLTISLLLNSSIWIKMRRLILPIIILFLVVHILMTASYAKKTSMEYQKMLGEYQASSEGKTHYEDYVIPKLFSPYVKRLDQGVEREYISFVYDKEMMIEY